MIRQFSLVLLIGSLKLLQVVECLVRIFSFVIMGGCRLLSPGVMIHIHFLRVIAGNCTIRPAAWSAMHRLQTKIGNS